jgi:hypothetical protein
MKTHINWTDQQVKRLTGVLYRLIHIIAILVFIDALLQTMSSTHQQIIDVNLMVQHSNQSSLVLLIFKKYYLYTYFSSYWKFTNPTYTNECILDKTPFLCFLSTDEITESDGYDAIFSNMTTCFIILAEFPLFQNNSNIHHSFWSIFPQEKSLP